MDHQTNHQNPKVAPEIKETPMRRFNLFKKAKKNEQEGFSLVTYMNDNWGNLSTIVGFKLSKLLSLDTTSVNDLLSDTYIKVMNKPSYFTPPSQNINGSLINWLSCIAYRLFLNQQRKNKKSVSCDPNILPLLAEQRLFEQHEWDSIILESHTESLRKYLYLEDEKEIFNYVVLGYKHHEIAAFMGMKSNTVHTKIARLTRRLAEAIKEEDQE